MRIKRKHQKQFDNSKRYKLLIENFQLTALSHIAPKLSSKLEIYMDGGIQTGNDVFKALALGAKAVFVGRPVLWGLAVAVGSRGLECSFYSCYVVLDRFHKLIKWNFEVSKICSGDACIYYSI